MTASGVQKPNMFAECACLRVRVVVTEMHVTYQALMTTACRVKVVCVCPAGGLGSSTFRERALAGKLFALFRLITSSISFIILRSHAPRKHTQPPNSTQLNQHGVPVS